MNEPSKKRYKLPLDPTYQRGMVSKVTHHIWRTKGDAVLSRLIRESKQSSMFHILKNRCQIFVKGYM